MAGLDREKTARLNSGDEEFYFRLSDHVSRMVHAAGSPQTGAWCANIQTDGFRPIFFPPTSRTKKNIRADVRDEERFDLPIHVKTLTQTIDLRRFTGILTSEQSRVWDDLKKYFTPEFYAGTSAEQHRLPTLSLSAMDANDLLAAGVAEPTHSPKLFCNAFTVNELAKSRRRCIHHPKTINDSTEIPRIRLPNSADLAKLATRHECVFAADYTAFYYQFELPPEIRDFFCFTAADGRTLRLTRLPMGVSFACALAHFVSTVIADKVSSPHTSLTYIDNTIFFGSRVDLARTRKNFLQLTAFLGVTVGECSDVDESAAFIGYEIDTKTKTLRNSEKTTRKFLDIDVSSITTLRRALQWFGKVMGLCRIHPEFLAQSFFLLKFYRRLCNKVQQGAYLDNEITIWPSLAPSVQRLQQALGARRVVHLRDNTEQTTFVASDASDYGFGFSLVRSDTVFHWGRPWSSHERSLHINEKELLAVLLTLRVINPEDSEHFLWILDNTTALATSCRGYSATKSLNDIMASVFREFPHFVQRTRFLWVESAANPSDGPSRGTFSFDPRDAWIALSTEHWRARLGGGFIDYAHYMSGEDLEEAENTH